MAELQEARNTLVSDRPSESNLRVSLHPLVLLTISDFITRHQLREQPNAVVGALLGQQKGREASLESAFECFVDYDSDGQTCVVDSWFRERLQAYRDVHKAPPLDFLGWFTVCPESGPTPALLSAHKQFLNMNESSLLLAFHNSAISSSSNENGKLPVTIYETVYENEQSTQDDAVLIDRQASAGLKFRSIPYTIETDETEMIAVDYVAKGAGNAGAVGGEVEVASPTDKEDKKGKKKVIDPPESQTSPNVDIERPSVLSPEEEDQIAALTTRLNSVQMLRSRLSTLFTYLSSLPPSNLSNPNSQAPIEDIHLPHLRNIKALITRLSLLTTHPDPASANTISFPTGIHPQAPPTDPLIHAQKIQNNDVNLTSLLAAMGQDVQALTELGRKFAIVEAEKQGAAKQAGPQIPAFMGGFGSVMDDSVLI